MAALIVVSKPPSGCSIYVKRIKILLPNNGFFYFLSGNNYLSNVSYWKNLFAKFSNSSAFVNIAGCPPELNKYISPCPIFLSISP